MKNINYRSIPGRLFLAGFAFVMFLVAAQEAAAQSRLTEIRSDAEVKGMAQFSNDLAAFLNIAESIRSSRTPSRYAVKKLQIAGNKVKNDASGFRNRIKGLISKLESQHHLNDKLDNEINDLQGGINIKGLFQFNDGTKLLTSADTALSSLSRDIDATIRYAKNSKPKRLISEGIFTGAALPAKECRTDKCRSAAQVLRDLYKRWGEVAIAAGCAVGVTVATGGIAMAATLECIKKADKYAKAVTEMIRLFNSIANNGTFTIGPRRIEWDRIQKGTVVSATSRVFISAAPVNKDRITVQVKKLAGRAQADIIICKVDERGRFVKLAQVEFEKGNKNIGRNITKTVSGVKGHLVQVRIDSDSALLKFKYELRITK